jgi:DNA-binding transcriptional LysR family regulator
MAMELRHLRYFVAVAEEGHITRAAERLGMQQPPLSQQIKALERELGVQLLYRQPRGVALTEAGQAFFRCAQDILAQLDRGIETTRRTARGELGQITVGVAATAHFNPAVTGAIRAFRESLPQVSLRLEEAGTYELMSRLHGGRVDVAFVRTLLGDNDGLVISALLEEPILIALPREHPLAKRQKNGVGALPLKALATEPFIFYRRPEGPGLTDMIIAACQAAGFNPRVGQEAPRPVSALNFVAAGLGVTLVPASLRRMTIDGVVFRDLKGREQPTAPLNVASRRGERSAVVRKFLNVVRNTAKSSARL